MAKRRDNERGAVSLITTVLMGMLMTLVVSGIASTMISESRQSTDAEQSMRAYYAAESGVEDAMAKLREAKSNGAAALAALQTGSSCVGTGDYDAPNELLGREAKQAGAGANWRPSVGWTCRTISMSAPPTGTLQQADQADQIDLAGAATKPSAIKVEWLSGANGCNAAGYSQISDTRLPPASFPRNCPPPVELTLVGYPGGTFGTDKITTQNVLIVPGQGGGGTGSLLQNSTKTAACGTTGAYKCSFTLSGLATDKEYVLRIRTRYTGSDYRLTFLDGSGNTIAIPTGTATIDVTGKAGAAYRRVVYKMPLSDVVAPGLNYVIYSGTDICKNLTTVGGGLPQDSCSPVPPGTPTPALTPTPAPTLPPAVTPTPVTPLNTPVPTPALTPTPVPTPDPNGDGGAKIDVGFCSLPNADPTKCGGAPAGGSYHYQYSATNIFPNVPANVRSCRLDWGDGTSTGDLPGSDPRCQYNGQFGDHYYTKNFIYGGRAERPYPAECKETNGGVAVKSVTQTLTINLWLGGTKTDRVDKALPHCY